MKTYRKKITSAILLASISCLLLFACKKDEEYQPQDTPDLTLKTFFENNRENNTQVYSMSTNRWMHFTGNEGTTVSFQPNSFISQSGNPVTGNVEIHLLEVYSKSDMILNNLPTIGQKDNGDLGTLISGGEFKIEAFQGGEKLNLKNRAFIKTKLQNFSTEMETFFGLENDGDVIWSPTNDDQQLNCDTNFSKFGSYCFQLISSIGSMLIISMATQRNLRPLNLKYQFLTPIKMLVFL